MKGMCVYMWGGGGGWVVGGVGGGGGGGGDWKKGEGEVTSTLSFFPLFLQ